MFLYFDRIILAYIFFKYFRMSSVRVVIVYYSNV